MSTIKCPCEASLLSFQKRQRHHCRRATAWDTQHSWRPAWGKSLQGSEVLAAAMSALHGEQGNVERQYVMACLRAPNRALYGLQAVCGGNNNPHNCFCPYMSAATSKAGQLKSTPGKTFLHAAKAFKLQFCSLLKPLQMLTIHNAYVKQNSTALNNEGI